MKKKKSAGQQQQQQRRDWDNLKESLIRKKLQGWPITRICAHARVSRRTFYRWWNRYRREGRAGLKERARGRPTTEGGRRSRR